MDAALAFAEQAVEIGKRTANADLQAFAADQPRQHQDRLRRDGRWLQPHGGGVDRGGQRRALADRGGRRLLLDDLRLSRPDRLRTGQRVDRGDREVLRAPVGRRLPRGLSRPSGGDQGDERRLGEAPRRNSGPATSELAAYNAVPPMADGLYAMADIRRLRGDLEGAEAALREAHGFGRTPQPALALIRLAEGKVKAASAGDQRRGQRAEHRPVGAGATPAGPGRDRDRRPRPRAGPRGGRGARAAGRDLPVAGAGGGRHQTLGRVLLAEGEAAGGRGELRTADQGPGAIVANPYEIARTRALLASALRALDDDDAAELELRAARDEFERLGRRSTWRPPRLRSSAAAERAGAAAQVRMTFMFTDIVGSTNLAEAMGDQAWERRPAVARRHASAAHRQGRRRSRQPDRRRVLRRVRLGAPGDRLRTGHPGGPRRASPDRGVRAGRPDRPAHGRGQPARGRLQRRRRPPRVPGRGTRRRRRDRGDARDARPRSATSPRRTPRGDRQGRVSAPVRVASVSWA